MNSGPWDVIRYLSAIVASRREDRKSTRLNSSHLGISYAVFCLKKKKNDDKSNLLINMAHISSAAALDTVKEKGNTGLSPKGETRSLNLLMGYYNIEEAWIEDE